MLAGILLKLCLAPFMAIGKVPWLAARCCVTWLLVHALRARLCGAGRRDRRARRHGVRRAVRRHRVADLVPRLEFVMPVFTWEAMVNIALPLFIVTMAGQNLPGLAVLAAYDYRPRVAPLFCSTGAASVARARRSACRRSISRRSRRRCAPGRTRMPTRRAATSREFSAASATWLLAALAGVAAVLVARSPPVLIEAVAGLALIGAFGGAMLNAVQEEDGRCPG